MFGVRSVVVSGAGVLVSCALWAGSASAASVAYDQEMRMGPQVFKSRVQLKGDRFRIETAMQGMTSITVRNAEGVYTYMPGQGMAMRMPSVDPAQGPVEHAEDYLAYLKEINATLLGSERLDGHACDIYRFTHPSTGGMTTAWVWKEKGFPIKMEIATPQGLVTMHLTNIQFNAVIADAAFQLPPGVQIMDMSQMMGGGGIPGMAQIMNERRR